MDENVLHWLKVLEVALIASVKFVIAPFEAERYHFNYKEAFLITTAGGIAGILAFTFIGELIAFGWRQLVSFFRKPLHSEGKQRKKFTWLNKFIIKTKMGFGLFGIIVTTPLVISIPIGTFMVHRFSKKKARNILFLMLSVFFWSILINGIAQYLKLSQYIPK